MKELQNPNGGLPIYLDDLTSVQNEIISANNGSAEFGGKPYIISGCNWSGETATEISLSSGWVFLDGEPRRFGGQVLQKADFPFFFYSLPQETVGSRTLKTGGTAEAYIEKDAGITNSPGIITGDSLKLFEPYSRFDRKDALSILSHTTPAAGTVGQYQRIGKFSFTGGGQDMQIVFSVIKHQDTTAQKHFAKVQISAKQNAVLGGANPTSIHFKFIGTKEVFDASFFRLVRVTDNADTNERFFELWLKRDSNPGIYTIHTEARAGSNSFDFQDFSNESNDPSGEPFVFETYQIADPLSEKFTDLTANLKTRVYPIGPWDMNSTIQLQVPLPELFGFDLKRIRQIDVTVITDAETEVYPMNYEAGFSAELFKFFTNDVIMILRSEIGSIFSTETKFTSSSNRGYIIVRFV